MQSETISFCAVVKVVTDESRRMGLAVPGFRSPPKLDGADRTIRRAVGEVVVAVRIRGRPFADVVADVIEGVVVANAIGEGPDLAVRRRLLATIEASVREVA